MSDYAKAKWKKGAEEGTIVVEDDGADVVVAEGIGEEAAARIVTCVNFCAGLQNESLANSPEGGLAGLVGAVSVLAAKIQMAKQVLDGAPSAEETADGE